MYTSQEFAEGMQAFGDPKASNFRQWPETTGQAASLWAQLIDDSTASISPPVNPAVRQLAKNVLEKQLEILFGVRAGMQALPAALQLYSATLAPGMLPAFTGIPPAIPVD